MDVAEEIKDNEFENSEHNEDEEVSISTHEKVNSIYSGEIQKLELGYVELSLNTIKEMIADKYGLIHGGFIFSSADYAAMLAVNEKNVVLVACDCQFLSPVKYGDTVNIIAKVRHKEGRKRNVNVTGYVFDIKVFEGEFKTVVTERHVLKINLAKNEGEE
jgi:acyl-CoA thioesterase